MTTTLILNATDQIERLISLLIPVSGKLELKQLRFDLRGADPDGRVIAERHASSCLWARNQAYP